jgi:hypothetical protein
LKPGGTIALFGYNFEIPNKLFKKLEASNYLVSGKYDIPYYIGVKI